VLRKLVGKLFGFEAEIEQLKEQISQLSADPVFGIWTRNAFLQFCHVMPRGLRVLTFLDLDNLHQLNDQYGYEEVNHRIRAIFSIPFRRSDLVARWFSGDEIVILFDADQEFALRKIGQLEEAARQQGMSFHFELGTWNVGKEPVEKVIDELSDKVLARKSWEKQQSP
jgi:diguanylate cyclase (GGDEF)-like protein